MDDKRICESCAVALHDGGCDDALCKCYGYRCAFCRKKVVYSGNAPPKAWTENSALYWKRRTADLAGRLEDCALVLTTMSTQVVDLQAQLHELKHIVIE